jgi:hypothetical protein
MPGIRALGQLALAQFPVVIFNAEPSATTGGKTWTKEDWTRQLEEHMRANRHFSAVHLGKLGGIASGKARRR